MKKLVCIMSVLVSFAVHAGRFQSKPIRKIGMQELLDLAAAAGRFKTVQEIVASGKLNLKNSSRPLAAAVAKRDVKMVNYFIKHGIRLQKDSRKPSEILEAAIKGFMTSAGQEQEDFGKIITALMQAGSTGTKELVRRALAYKLPPMSGHRQFKALQEDKENLIRLIAEHQEDVIDSLLDDAITGFLLSSKAKSSEFEEMIQDILAAGVTVPQGTIKKIKAIKIEDPGSAQGIFMQFKKDWLKQELEPASELAL